MWRAALLLFVLFPLAAPAQPASYRIDETRTRATFEVEHLGVFRARGNFESLAGTLLYDGPAQAGAVDLSIAVASVRAGWDSRDEFLRGASMLDAVQFPSMHFVSRRFEFEAGRLVRVEGDLTLHGTTNPVTLVVRSIHCERSSCVAEASGSISRRAFAMDNWWPLIGDEVHLHLHLSAVRD